MGIQLAFNNARAAIEALLKQPSEFVRTPKSGEQLSLTETSQVVISGNQAQLKQLGNKSLSLYSTVVPNGFFIELFAAIVYLSVMFWAFNNQIWIMIPFLLLLVIGFLSSALGSMFQQLKPQVN